MLMERHVSYVCITSQLLCVTRYSDRATSGQSHSTSNFYICSTVNSGSNKMQQKRGSDHTVSSQWKIYFTASPLMLRSLPTTDPYDFSTYTILRRCCYSGHIKLRAPYGLVRLSVYQLEWPCSSISSAAPNTMHQNCFMLKWKYLYCGMMHGDHVSIHTLLNT